MIHMGRTAITAFEEIKYRLIKLAVLHLPNSAGRFLYSDTSKFPTGSVLYQIQNGNQN